MDFSSKCYARPVVSFPFRGLQFTTISYDHSWGKNSQGGIAMRLTTILVAIAVISAEAEATELMTFDVSGTARVPHPRYMENPRGFVPTLVYFGCAFPSGCALAEMRINATAADVGTTFVAPVLTVAKIDTAIHSGNPFTSLSYADVNDQYEFREIIFNQSPEIWHDEYQTGGDRLRISIQAHVPSFDGYRITGMDMTINAVSDTLDGRGSATNHVDYTVRLHGDPASPVPEPATWLILCLGLAHFGCRRRKSTL